MINDAKTGTEGLHPKWKQQRSRGHQNTEEMNGTPNIWEPRTPVSSGNVLGSRFLDLCVHLLVFELGCCFVFRAIHQGLKAKLKKKTASEREKES